MDLGLPDEAVVCSCNNVCKADIVDAAEQDTSTRAGSTCGSCKPVVKQIVEEYFTAPGRGRRPQPLRALPADPAGAVRRGGGPRLRPSTRSSRPTAAVRVATSASPCWPRSSPVWSVGRCSRGRPGRSRTPTTPTSQTSSATARTRSSHGSREARSREKLIVIGEVARDFGLYTKITGGQRIDLFGARLEELPAIWRRLVDAGFESGHAYGKALRTVKSCVGSTWCRYGVQDSVGLAIDLELGTAVCARRTS